MPTPIGSNQVINDQVCPPGQEDRDIRDWLVDTAVDAFKTGGTLGSVAGAVATMHEYDRTLRTAELLGQYVSRQEAFAAARAVGGTVAGKVGAYGMAWSIGDSIGTEIYDRYGPQILDTHEAAVAHTTDAIEVTADATDRFFGFVADSTLRAFDVTSGGEQYGSDPAGFMSHRR